MVAAIVFSSAMVETRRLNGTVRQRHIASLGAITLERERTHRFRLLVKSPRRFDRSAYLREWLAAAPRRKGKIRLDVDVDPQSFL